MMMMMMMTCSIYRVNIKSTPYTTFVDISAMREDFYVTFYNNVKQ